MPRVLCSFHIYAASSFRATQQGHMQTYCPLCPPHRELHMLPTPHTTTTTIIITITAAIYLFVCYRQLWYSAPCCSLCPYGVLCGTTLILCCAVRIFVSLNMLFVLCVISNHAEKRSDSLSDLVILSRTVTCMSLALFYVHVPILYCH